MEEVNDDHVQGKTPALHLAGDGENLLLGAVAQAALPVAQAVLRHPGRPAGGRRIEGEDLRGGVPGDDIVVQLARAREMPFREVFREGHGAHAGVVPQKAVAQAGHIEGDAGLGIPVLQLQHGALLVQASHLVLAHAEDLLPVVRLKAGEELIVRRPGNRPQLPCGDIEGQTVAVHPVAVPPALPEERLPPGVLEGEPALLVEMRRDLAVAQREGASGPVEPRPLVSPVPGVCGVLFLLRDLGVRGGDRLRQRPVVLRERAPRHPHPDPVFAPGLDPKQRRAVSGLDRRVLRLYVHLRASLRPGVPGRFFQYTRGSGPLQSGTQLHEPQKR